MFSLKCTLAAQDKIKSVAEKNPPVYVEIYTKAQVLVRNGVAGELRIAQVQKCVDIYVVGTIAKGPGLFVLHYVTNQTEIHVCDLVYDLPVNTVDRYQFIKDILVRDGFPSTEIDLGPN